MKPNYFTIATKEENDLCRLFQKNNIEYTRHPNPEDAVENALPGTGVLILADLYPEKVTPIQESLFNKARKKKLRVYIEYPENLPGISLVPPRKLAHERVVVLSGAFQPELEKKRILMINDCSFIPVKAEKTHLAMARIAGFDFAAYDLPEAAFPILFEHENLLIATTKLSQFITGRYAPTNAWPIVWRWILNWLFPSVKIPELRYAKDPAPSYEMNDILPVNSEESAFKKGVKWFENAKLFIHPEWNKEAERRLCDYPDGTGAGPNKEWPVGDGTYGMIEGASSFIHHDGTQDWRYHVRADCMGETSMAMAFSGKIFNDNRQKSIAANLNDFIYFNSPFAQGTRANPESPSCGLVLWTSNDDLGGIYYGDDNARCILGSISAAALLENDRWLEPAVKAVLANFRTTGPQGYRGGALNEDNLQEKGWRHYFNENRTNYAPHYESWLWACYLWAYNKSGFAPFLEKSLKGIESMMNAYPHHWRWTNGLQQERARMLLPLAWLVRIDNKEKYRKWLRLIAEDLVKAQDLCGAICEALGTEGNGSYGPPKTNEDYGTAEAPLIHQNGDPVCDLLYTSNFAFIGLHEAAAATGESFYKRAEDRLSDFLCRCQIKSENHPDLNGAWFRAFDYNKWDYWAADADLGWGVWCIESGWTQAWITTTLGLRHTETSLWDLIGKTDIEKSFNKLMPIMLPDAAR